MQRTLCSLPSELHQSVKDEKTRILINIGGNWTLIWDDKIYGESQGPMHYGPYRSCPNARLSFRVAGYRILSHWILHDGSP